jgi:hypothetical protein
MMNMKMIWSLFIKENKIIVYEENSNIICDEIIYIV